VKITLKKAPIEVPFPPNPSLVVTVKRLSAMDSFGIQQKIREATIKEPEIHPISGEPIFDKAGNVAHRREQLSPQEILGILKSIVVDWRGLEIDGVETPYAGDPSVLLEDDFIYQTEVEVVQGGKPVRKMAGRTFWMELLEVARGNQTAADKAVEEQEGKVGPTQ